MAYHAIDKTEQGCQICALVQGFKCLHDKAREDGGGIRQRHHTREHDQCGDEADRC